MFRRPIAIATIVIAALAAAPAQAARYGAPCAGASLRAVASRTHSHLSACIVQRGAVVTETTYYQNASKEGGTALAAFPEARMRYGVAPHVEVFADLPSEIAKSGLRGAGVYYMTQTGIGAKIEFARAAGVVYSFTAERRPPMNALANMDVIPNFEAHVDATWSPSRHSTATVELGALNFSQRGIANWSHTSPTAALSFSNEIDRKTSVSLEFAMQSLAAHGGTSQMAGTIGLQRALSKRVQMNLELGTTFNATGGSKPHYFGFGFITH